MSDRMKWLPQVGLLILMLVVSACGPAAPGADEPADNATLEGMEGNDNIGANTNDNVGGADVNVNANDNAGAVNVNVNDNAGGANVNDNTGAANANDNTAANTNDNEDNANDNGDDEDDDGGQVDLEGAEGMTLGEAVAELTDEESVAMFLASLNAVLASGGLGEVDLEETGFILFIPTDEALAELEVDALSGLATDAAAAEAFFGCYLVQTDEVTSEADLAAAGMLTAQNGDAVAISGTAGSLTLNGSVQVVQVIQVQNGLIVIVDGLLCEPGM